MKQALTAVILLSVTLTAASIAQACEDTGIKPVPAEAARKHQWIYEQKRTISDMSTRGPAVVRTAATTADCTGVTIEGYAILPVGLAGTLVGDRATGKSIGVGGVDPKINIGTFTVSVKEKGRPVPGAKVEIWAVADGDFRSSDRTGHSFGMTKGHYHIYRNNPVSSLATVQIVEFPSIRDTVIHKRGEHVTRTTDSQGKLQFGIMPGWRGGVEQILVKWTNGPPGTEIIRSRSVAVRSGLLADFGNTGGFNGDNPAKTTAAWPFKLIGADARHPFEHFVQLTPAERLIKTLIAARSSDLNDYEENLSREKPEKGYFWQMNDMSVEYGGAFHVDISETQPSDNPNCDSAYRGPPRNLVMPWPHKTHNAGADFDVGLCYANTVVKRVSGKSCLAGGGRKVNQDVLRAFVEGSGIGVVHVEGNHLHIRIKGEKPNGAR